MLTDQQIHELQAALALKEKELQLVVAMDTIRDTVTEPSAMLLAITELLVERFEAELGLLFLLNRETGAMELTAITDHSQWWCQWPKEAIHLLVERFTSLSDITVWGGRDIWPEAAPAWLPATTQLAVAPVIMGAAERLGTLALARSNTPFTSADVQLLKTAEDQVDSAIIQAYTQRKLNLNQNELALMVAIDEIRDTQAEPEAMLGAVVRLLAEHFHLDQCLLYLYDQKRDHLGLRAAYGRDDMETLGEQALAEKAYQLNAIALWAVATAAPEATPGVRHWAATPIIMGTDERLGAILLARTTPFEQADVQLLKTAEDQIDSAIIQAYAKAKLEWKQKELDFIMAVDEIRDSADEPAKMLSAIVTLLARQLHADACLLFLLDPETRAVELRAMHDRSQRWGQIERWVTQALAEHAVALPDLVVWEGGELAGIAGDAELPDQLQVVAVPIIMGVQERLGAILVARTEQLFSQGDLLLLKIAEDQIDSAIVQGYAYEKLRQHSLELETIFRIDRIRDRGLPLDEMLNAVIRELTTTIEAEIGFVMLYDRTGRELEMRASTHENLLQTLPYYEAINQAIRKALEQGELVHEHRPNESLRSIMCLPLILNQNIIGVLGMLNRYGAHGFTAIDRRLLTAIGSQIDTAIYERSEIGLLRQVLGRAIDPHVLDRLLTNPDVDFLKGEQLELTVLYADLRGSTALAEKTKPDQLVEFIKDYLEQMTDVILKYEGTVDKFVGDEVMALFGAPVPQPDHALRAIHVGLAMQKAYTLIQHRWQVRGLPAPLLGIGIATGTVIAGEMGGPQRTQYTVIGRAANLGARICGEAKGGEVLISARTYELTQGRLEATVLPGKQFKGIEGETLVYCVQRALN